MAHRTKGLECDEVWICLARARSRALIIISSGHMALSALSREVSTTSCLESVGQSHLGSQRDHPDDVKILQE